MKTTTLFRIVILILFVAALFTACLSDNSDYDYEAEQQKIVEQLEKDTTIIFNYLAEHNLEATRHSSGIFYTIHEQGSYPSPTTYSTVEVKYTGYLTNDSIFGQTVTDETATFYLGYLIGGWQIGLQLIGKGGEITLYLPSYYGYGAEEKTKIPANSVLIYDIELVDFD